MSERTSRNTTNLKFRRGALAVLAGSIPLSILAAEGQFDGGHHGKPAVLATAAEATRPVPDNTENLKLIRQAVARARQLQAQRQAAEVAAQQAAARQAAVLAAQRQAELAAERAATTTTSTTTTTVVQSNLAPSSTSHNVSAASYDSYPSDYAAWSKVANCEEGGWVGYAGYNYPDSLGIDRANWFQFGGGSDVSPAAEIIVADRLIAYYHAGIPDQNGCQPGGW